MASLSFLDRAHSVAPPGYSRWLIPPAALAIHLCIGQVYATSVYKTSLIEDFDASEKAIGYIFSLAIVMLGLSAAVFGTWVDRSGPRKAMFTAACCWCLGFLVAALGISTGQLWLVYAGYGVIGGIGIGIGYISPVSTLMKWFPDRPGLATGMAIMGFGGGAMIASPLAATLLPAFGPATHPVVPGTTTPNLALSIYDASAVSKLFVTLGIVYFVVMMFGVFTVRVPAPGWKPDHFDPSTVTARPLVTTANVSASNAIRTPQFWLLWVVLLCNVTAGIGILENASPMIQDFFRHADGTSSLTSDPTKIGAVAAGFVGLLSIFNMGGRFVWSTISDLLGRKVNYMIYLGGSLALYVLLATVGAGSVGVFVLVCSVIISFYGGGFSTAPAYLRDLFGTYQVGAIHGRLLTAWSTAGVLGPLIVNGILDSSGKKPGSLEAGDYRMALLTMVGVLAVGFVANLAIRPVSERFHEQGPVVDAVEAAHH